MDFYVKLLTISKEGREIENRQILARALSHTIAKGDLINDERSD
jgi:hypothetical protein